MGEKSSPKYDIAAVLCVAVGTLIIILLSNKEQQTFTVAKIIDLLLAFRSVIYFLATILAMISVKIVTPKLLHKLRIFEKDCEKWEK